MNKKKALGILLAFTMCSGVIMFNAKAATSPTTIIQTIIDGFGSPANNGVQFFGTFVYGGLAFTGLSFNLVGQILPGPLGNVFTVVGNGIDNANINANYLSLYGA